MGNTNTNVKLSSTERKTRDNLKQETTNNTIKKIDTFQNNILSSSTTLVKTEDVKKAIVIGENAKKNLARNDKPLIKGDYIAIICRLDQRYINKIDELNKLTGQDLISIIRNDIYDPNKVVNISRLNIDN